jgi:arylsulfatase A-like enzyme
MAGVAAGVDKAIGRIVLAYQRAGLYDRTDFVVTADHGMVPNSHTVSNKQMYAGVRATKTLSLEMDFLFTAGYLYLRDPHDSQRVAAALVARHYPYVEGALYKVTTDSGSSFRADDQTARALGPDLTQAYVDLSNTLATFSGPDVVLPYDEDSMAMKPSTPGAPLGNHGGLSWRVQHIPLVLSGPGIRHGASSYPAKLVDIAPTVERLLGLPVPAAVDGVALADALSRPADADRRAEEAVAGSRSRDVDALIVHSLRQHALVLQVR